MVMVVKGNGTEEPFSEEKVIASIKRAGIPQEMEVKVLSHIKEKLFNEITTAEIHNHIREFLKHAPQPGLAAKYDIKRAIMALGPTGYPFEDYVAKLLTYQGYQTKTRTILRGKCITHEIDVIATKDKKTTMIEAKFHNGIGIKTDVHVAMYTQARFQDIKEKNAFDEVMLICNTRITEDALAYGACMGMKVISWSYPEGNSLRDWIEKMALYPITALTTLSNIQKAQLLQNDVVLCLDLCQNHKALDMLSLPQHHVDEILAEASFACSR